MFVYGKTANGEFFEVDLGGSPVYTLKVKHGHSKKFSVEYHADEGLIIQELSRGRERREERHGRGRGGRGGGSEDRRLRRKVEGRVSEDEVESGWKVTSSELLPGDFDWSGSGGYA